MAGERPARWPAVAMVALMVAVPVATWWAVGDLSTDLPDPDYQIRPVAIGHTTEQVAGVTAAHLVGLYRVPAFRCRGSWPPARCSKSSRNRPTTAW